MKNYWILPLLLCILLTGCKTDQVAQAGQSFWETHTTWQLLGWVFFPRIMFIFFSAMTGGIGFWIGVILVPRVMVAFWATYYYFETNPILCILSWLYAVIGEGGEKATVRNKK